MKRLKRLLIVLMAILVLLPSCGRQEEPPNSLPKEVKEHTSDGDYVDSAQAAELFETYGDLGLAIVGLVNSKFDGDSYMYKHLTDRQRKEITDYGNSILERIASRLATMQSLVAKLEKGEKITNKEFKVALEYSTELLAIADIVQEDISTFYTE